MMSCVSGCENCNISVHNGEYRVGFRPVIINISEIVLLDTNFGLRFLGFLFNENASFLELSSG